MKKSSWVISLSLFLIGIVVCLISGRRGYLPLDQSIIFDGGWRLLCGQIPFKDFTTPNALVPILMQAVFFKLFGVTWFVYCLHAAVMNGLFCALVFAVLREFACPMASAFLYAGLSSFCYYAPIGVPYIEQHGFFFLLCAVFFAVKFRKTVAARYMTLCVISLCLTYLCKQNVAMVGILPVGVVCCLAWRQWKRLLLTGITSFIGCIALQVGVMQAFGMEWSKIQLYFFYLPAKIGQERLALAQSRLVEHLVYMLIQYLISPPLILLLTTATVATVILWYIQTKTQLSSESQAGVINILLGGSLTASCVIFALTANQHELQGYPYLFLCIGIVHCGVILMVSQYSRFGLLWIGICFCCFSCYELYFVYRAVMPRYVIMGTEYDEKNAITLHTPAMRFMRFQVNPKYYRCSGNNFDAVIDFFIAHEGNFLLIGDNAILYGLTGRPSVAPSLWLHQGLTFPPPQMMEDWQAYQKALLKSMNDYRVEYIVLEASSMAGISAETFPMLLSALEQETLTEHRIGDAFLILERQ